MSENRESREAEEQKEEFGELLKYTGAGFVGGLVLAFVLDSFAFQRSGIGQWIVRTLSGEGESLFEGFYALRQRLKGAVGSMAEAYGWGKLIGMVFPWIVDWTSRLAGLDVYGVEGFYIAYFYAMSDQIGANVSGFVFLQRKHGAVRRTLSIYSRNAVMLASLLVILATPIGLLIARLLGFSPTTQVSTALETIAANLCWVPPLVGWIQGRREVP